MAYSTQQKQRQVVDIARSIFSHNNLYLIGTAEKGAVNVPVRVNNLKQAKRYFGDNGTLIEAMKQLEGIPSRQEIYLVKTTGSHATCYLNLNDFGSETHNGVFMIRSVHAYDLANEIQVTVGEEALEVIPPASTGLPTLTYSYKSHPTIGQLIEAINADAKDGISVVEAQCSFGEHLLTELSLKVCNVTHHRLTGGNSGLNATKNRLYYALADTYSVLEGLEVDIIVPLECHIDDLQEDFSHYGDGTYGNSSYNNKDDRLSLCYGTRRLTYYDQLLEYCYRQLSSGIFTHGVIGFHPTEEKSIERWAKAWTKTKENSLYFSTYAYLVSVVAGDLHYNYYQSKGSGVLAYASLISGLSVEQCPYNHPFTSTLQLAHEFTRQESRDLNELGFVTFRNSLLHQTVVAHHDGTPYIDDELGLRYFHNVRMCQIVAKAVRQVVDQYIGENLNRLLKYNSLEQDVEKLLTIFHERGIIKEYQFKIDLNESLGTAHIRLSMKAKYMIESVEVIGQIQTEGVQDE